MNTISRRGYTLKIRTSIGTKLDYSDQKTLIFFREIKSYDGFGGFKV